MPRRRSDLPCKENGEEEGVKGHDGCDVLRGKEGGDNDPCPACSSDAGSTSTTSEGLAEARSPALARSSELLHDIGRDMITFLFLSLGSLV
jgi:hypothetical protein